MNRDQAIHRLNLVEGELAAAKFALARTIAQMDTDASLLTRTGLAFSDLRRASRTIETTFIVRIFAQFEAAVRDYWNTIKSTEPRMQDLLNGIAARNYMLPDWLFDAHLVREYRNDIVHQGDQIARLSFADCRSRLCRFLSQLPRDW